MKLNIGDKAPDFSMMIDSGKEVRLKDYAGKWLILYFYPKDSTPGCTTEACDFRDNMEYLQSADAEVLGVSPNSVKSHVNFKTKKELNFPLGVDVDKKVAEAYGAFGEKKMYGKTFLGIIRSTFIINPEGTIAEAWYKVRVKGHVSAVIEKLNELKK